MEVFSKYVRDEDDEEALKWAALEKLPTFDMLRKDLLLRSQGAGASEIDIDNLGTEERKKILQRLVNVAEKDNEKFLLKLRDRVDTVGIDLPLIEVRFEHLKIEAQAHVGSRAVPSFLKFNISIAEGLLDTLRLLPNKKLQLTILNEVSGILRPCRMTLLLGPPSSGKTTLLLALAGKLDPTFSGKVTYNGHERTEFVLKRTETYISRHDLHIRANMIST
ncbi:transcription factor [Orobanche hederae]